MIREIEIHSLTINVQDHVKILAIFSFHQSLIDLIIMESLPKIKICLPMEKKKTPGNYTENWCYEFKNDSLYIPNPSTVTQGKLIIGVKLVLIHFSFPLASCLTKDKKNPTIFPIYLPMWVGNRTNGFMPLPMGLKRNTNSLNQVWTRITDSISNEACLYKQHNNLSIIHPTNLSI